MSTPFLVAFGRYAAGSIVASANFAAQAASLGVRTGAAAAGALATAAGGVPGAGLVRKMAEAVEREAAAAEEQASLRASASVDGLANRLGDGRSEWVELAADTAAAPLSGLAAVAAAMGVEAFNSAASTRPGRAALDAVVRNARGDAGAQRESLVAVASDSGAAAIRGGFSVAETAVRLAFSDTRRLRRAIAGGVDQMRLLADAGEMHDLLPVPAVDEEVRARARRVVERAPARLLAALEEPSPRIGKTLAAMLDDAEPLRVFVVAYSQVATLVVTRVSRLLIAGSLSFSDVEAFLEGRRLAGQAWRAGGEDRPEHGLQRGLRRALPGDGGRRPGRRSLHSPRLRPPRRPRLPDARRHGARRGLS
jgi:hypothetical protein